MYAGGVYEKYGIHTLVEGFRAIKNENIELDIYGPGDAVQYVKSSSLVDRRIRYCGVAPADEMLQLEQSASLLVITRPTDEEYTKYSFPSKIIEYMASGTPVLSTKLAGIPDEYRNHIFWFDEGSVSAVSSRLKEVIEKDDQELYEFGKAAQKFLLAEKSAQAIAAKLIKFLYS